MQAPAAGVAGCGISEKDLTLEVDRTKFIRPAADREPSSLLAGFFLYKLQHTQFFLHLSPINSSERIQQAELNDHSRNSIRKDVFCALSFGKRSACALRAQDSNSGAVFRKHAKQASWCPARAERQRGEKRGRILPPPFVRIRNEYRYQTVGG